MLSKKLIVLFYYFSVISNIISTDIDSNPNYVSFPASENGTCYKRVLYDESIAANISEGLVQLVTGSQHSGAKTGNGYDWVTIIDCCEGYIRNKDNGKCETHCDEGCIGGTCTGPNICTCENGWLPESGVCKAVCHNPCPENSYCFSPDFCTCKFGYELIDGFCRPFCPHDCLNGDCVAPRDCRCHPGYFLNDTKWCEPICESGCTNGTCVSPGICECEEGYVNPLNNKESCIPRCPDTCINGECNSPDVCTCKSGYVLNTNGSCTPQCANECINGYCASPDQCACNPGYSMNPHLKFCVKTLNINGRNNFQDSGAHQVYNNNKSDFSPANNNTNKFLESSRTHLRNQSQTISPYGESYGGQNVQNKNYTTNHQGNIYKPNNYYNPYETNTTQTRQEHHSRESYDISIYDANQPVDQSHNDQSSVSIQKAVPIFVSNGSSTPFKISDPYKNYGSNKSHELQGPFYGQIDGTQRLHPIQKPYDIYEPQNVPYNNQKHKQNGPFPSQEINSTQNARDMYTTNRTQILQNNYRQPNQTTNRFSYIQENRFNESPKPFPEQKLNHTPVVSNNFFTPKEIESPNRNTNNGQSENTRTHQTSGTTGINYAYNNDKTKNTQPNTPIQSHGQNYGPYPYVYSQVPLVPLVDTILPYDAVVQVKNEEINKNPKIINGYNSNSYQPVCNFPCFNGKCTAPNTCTCNHGYALDPQSPYTNVCTPVCSGGCINGICTAPNQCICNYGFVKENGLKGSRVCIPIYQYY